MDFLNILVQKGYLEKSEIPKIKKELAGTDKKGLEDILITHGVEKSAIMEAKSEYYGVPARDIDIDSIPYDVLKYIPEKSAEHYKIVPLSLKEGVLEVGFVDPDNMEARDAVQFIASKSNIPYKVFLISESDFDKSIGSYGGLSGEVSKALTELEAELSADEKEISENIKEVTGPEDKSGVKTRIIEDAPVTKIVATILRYATEGGASDIHIEPMTDTVRVRFRVDGTLHTSLILPKKVHSAVVARVKILSNMKLDEKRKPQDGRFSAHIENRKIDFRVSTFPAYYGEKVVMRILDSEKGVIKLEKLGLSERNLSLIRDAITRPYGLILISGPTGSGKTTTLYSMLNEVDREGMNVLSLEDPVEYNIEGMSQSQIRPEIGYTFANGLRTTLRQDPDVIMVGEIRDKETAGLAVQAALTGHLVFSTIHTNNAIGVIPRLIDMGVDPFLIAPTLILAIAQRLVKTLCPGAGESIPVEGSIMKMIERELDSLPEEFRKDIQIPAEVKNSAPGPDCPTGTRGRAAVMEVLAMDKEIEGILLEEANEQLIAETARQHGMLSMKEDAMLKAFEGIVPWEEVNKL